MVSKLNTVFLGYVQRISSKTNKNYNVISFMDEGEPVSVMLNENFDVSNLPNVMTKCELTVKASLGRYQKVEVLDVEPI